MNIEILQSQKSTKTRRAGASVNAYLILKKNDKICLHLRNNTGYCDGYYGLISGHVEDGEAASIAMIREAAEEAGIEIAPESLRVVHIIHRQSDRQNIDLFFECSSWKGTVANQEPEKCAGLDFYPLSHLPSNTIDYIAEVLKNISLGISYSEMGWNT